jgi:phosphoribosyl-AMP cyclohydrolase
MKKQANVLEEGGKVMLDFCKLQNYFTKDANEREIMPVVVQNAITKEVLILAYVNKQALEYSLRNRVAAFWSTSRDELWIKGLTSGSVLRLVEIRVNCDQNSLLYLVEPLNNAGACHTKDENGYRASCYYRVMSADGGKLEKPVKGEKDDEKL